MSEIVDMNYLIDNIYSLNLKKILKKYKLTEEFIVNYILNPNYQLTEVEKKITINDVYKYQLHIDKEKFIQLYLIGSVDEGRPNFEEISKL
jgi:hypothetical protein